MSSLQQIQSQLNDINMKRVKLQTLIEQAQKQCEVIEQKYGIKSPEELQELMDKTQKEYEEQLKQAEEYITKTNEQLAQYNGVI